MTRLQRLIHVVRMEFDTKYSDRLTAQARATFQARLRDLDLSTREQDCEG